MYFEDKKVVNFEDGVDGFKRVSYENGVDITTDQPIVETIDVRDWEWEVNKNEDRSVDASEARNNRAIYVVDELYGVLKNLDVKTTEISYILQKLLGKVSGVESQAILNSFGKANEGDVRLSDWENKL